jgi:hypothetical protein
MNHERHAVGSHSGIYRVLGNRDHGHGKLFSYHGMKGRKGKDGGIRSGAPVTLRWSFGGASVELL